MNCNMKMLLKKHFIQQKSCCATLEELPDFFLDAGVFFDIFIQSSSSQFEYESFIADL